MFDKATNSKKQGDIGLGVAIAYFAAEGYVVNIPLTDSQDYDLIVDDGELLQRIQVKTTSYKARDGKFRVSLTTKGGNKSGQTVKKFDKTKVDRVFVLTSDGKKYVIPVEDLVGNNTISLCDTYDDFIV